MAVRPLLPCSVAMCAILFRHDCAALVPWRGMGRSERAPRELWILHLCFACVPVAPRPPSDRARRAGAPAGAETPPFPRRGDRASVTPIAYLHPHHSVKAKLTVSAKHTPAGPGKRAFVRSGAGGFASH